MSNIWLTSDTHFFHNKPFIYEARGFKTIEEMNEKIVSNWNSLIQNDDIVYHLGDVYMGTDHEAAFQILSKLKGKKYLAFGNHDTDKKIELMKTHNIFEDIQMGYRLKKGKKTFILTHRPTITTDEAAKGVNKNNVISLHGHTHAVESFNIQDLSMIHVGLDSWNCRPVKLEEIINILKNK